MRHELIFSTSWGGNKGNVNVNPETRMTGEIKFPEAVVRKHHVKRFMCEQGYDGLVPRMELWCKAWKQDNFVYVRMSELERITWPTFISHMKEWVEVHYKVVPQEVEVM